MNQNFWGDGTYSFGEMLTPFSPARRKLEKLIISVLGSPECKKELSNYIRTELQAEKARVTKDNNQVLSYDMLTRGNVNMQAKMAQNGYDVYGKNIIQANAGSMTNANLYKNMKNRIHYGANRAKNPYENRGNQNRL